MKPRSAFIAVDPSGNPLLSTLRYGPGQTAKELRRWLDREYPGLAAVKRRGWRVVPVTVAQNEGARQ